MSECMFIMKNGKPSECDYRLFNENGNIFVEKDPKDAGGWLEKWKNKDKSVKTLTDALQKHKEKYAKGEKATHLSQFFDKVKKVFPFTENVDFITVELDKFTWKTIKTGTITEADIKSKFKKFP